MADFRPLLWDGSVPVKRRFKDTDTLLLDTDGTNSIFDLKISSSTVFKLDNNGRLIHTDTDSGTTGFHSHETNVTTGNLVDNEWAYGHYVDMDGSAITPSTSAAVIAYGATASGLGTGAGVAFHADATWTLGMYSQAAITVSSATSSSAIQGSNSSTGGAFEGAVTAMSASGQKALALSVDNTAAAHTGKLFYGAWISLTGHANAGTNDDYNFSGLRLEYTESGSVSASTRAIDIDGDWDYGIYSLSPALLSITGTTPFVTYDGTGGSGSSGNINTDSSLGESIRVIVEGSTRWIPCFTDPDMDNIGGSGTLDDAYNASAGASLVNVDAGSLTWRLSSTYSFIVDDGTNDYLNITQADGGVNLAASATDAGAALVLESLSAGGTLSGTSAGALSLQSTGSTIALTSSAGMTLSAGNSSSFSTSAGNLNLTCASGTMTQNSLTGNYSSRRALNLTAATDAGNYGFNLENQGALSSYVQTTNGGDLYIWADSDSSSASLDIRSGNTTVITAGGAGAYDLRLIASTTGGNGDIEFQARGSGLIPFNAVAPDNVLVGFTATSIIGALNELKSATPSVTLDDAYNASAGPATIAVDSGAVTWNLTTASSNFVVSSTNPSFALDVVESNITSNGSAGANALTAFRTTFSSNASDSGTHIGFAAQQTGSVSGVTAYGFYANSSWDYGVYSEALNYLRRAVVGNTTTYNANLLNVYRNDTGTSPTSAIARIRDENRESRAATVAVLELTANDGFNTIPMIYVKGDSSTAAFSLTSKGKLDIYQSSSGDYLTLNGQSRLVTKNVYYNSAVANSLELYGLNHSIKIGDNGGLRTQVTGTLFECVTDRWDLDASGGAGACDLISAGGINMTAQGDHIYITSPSGSDIYFDARSSGDIPFNSATAGQTTLNGSLPQNIVGAINACYTGYTSVTLDQAYNNDGGAADIAVDAGDVSWNLSGGYKMDVSLAASSTNQTLLNVVGYATASSSHALKGVYAELNAVDPGTSGALTAFEANTSGTVSAQTIGFKATSPFDYGLYSDSAVYIRNTSGSAFDALTVEQQDSGQYILYMTGTGNTGWYYDPAGDVYHRTDDPTTSFTGFTTDVRGDDITTASQSIVGQKVTMRDSGAGTTASPTFTGFAAVFTNNGGTLGQLTGYYADANWDYGFASNSPAWVDVENITDSIVVAKIDGASGGLGATGKTVNVLEVTFTEDASAENATIHGIDVAITPEALAVSTTTGIDIGPDWTYGIYSSSPVVSYKSGLTSGYSAYIGGVSSSGVGSDNLIGMSLDITSDSTDSGDHYGISIYQSGDISSTAKAYGLYVDADWGYGVYSDSPAYFKNPSGSATTTLELVQENSGYYLVYGGGFGNTSYYLNAYGQVNQQTDYPTGTFTAYTTYVRGADITSASQSVVGQFVNMRDSGVGTTGSPTFTAFSAQFTNYGGTLGQLTGFYADANWDYGLYSKSPIEVNITPASAPTGTTYNLARVYYASPATGSTIADIVNLDVTVIPDSNGNDSVDFYGIYTDFDNSGGGAGANTFGYYATETWDLGMFSRAPIRVENKTAVTSAWTACTVKVTSGDVGVNSLYGVHAIINTHTNDLGAQAAFYAEQSGTSSSKTTAGFVADNNWDYGVFSYTPIVGDVSIDYSAGPGTGNEYVFYARADCTSQNGPACGLRIDHTNSAAASTFSGIELNGDSSSNPTTAITIDSSWNWGVSSNTKNRALITGVAAPSIVDIGAYNARVTSPGMTTSGALNFGVYSHIKPVGTDITGTSMYSFYADFDSATPGLSNHIAYGVDASFAYWNAGKSAFAFYSQGGQAYFSQTQVDGFGGYEYPVVTSRARSGGTGLDASDEFICFKAWVDDDADDSGDAKWYGFYYYGGGTQVGATPRRAYYADATLTNNDWAIDLESGRTEFEHDYGALGSGVSFVHNTRTSLSGGSNATAHAWNMYVLCATHTSDGDGFDIRGIQLQLSDNGGGSNSKGLYITSDWDTGIVLDTVGSSGIQATDSWFDISANSSVAIPGSTNGVIDLDVNFDSAVSSTSNGIHVDIDPNASDTSSCYWRSFSATMTGSAPTAGRYYGFYVSGEYSHGIFIEDPSTATGVYSRAFTNTFAREDNTTTPSAPTPVVVVSNVDQTTANAYNSPCLLLSGAYTGGPSYGLLALSSAVSSTTQGTVNAIKFTGAKTNRRMVGAAEFINSDSNATTQRWWLTYSFGPAWATTNTSAPLLMPIKAPHGSTLTRVGVYVNYATSVTNGGTLYVYRAPVGSGFPTSLGNTTIPATTGVQEVVVSSLSNNVIDNTTYSYYALVTSGTSYTGTFYCYDGRFDYQITDFAAACGF